MSALDRDYGVKAKKQNLLRAFRALDINRSNNLSRQELDRGWTRLGLWLPANARRMLGTTHSPPATSAHSHK